jgi:hypothetical protein
MTLDDYIQSAIQNKTPGYQQLQWHALNQYAPDTSVTTESGRSGTASTDFPIDPHGYADWMKSLGYSGPLGVIDTSTTSENGRSDATYSDPLSDWLKQQGYALQVRELPGVNQGEYRYVNGQGQQVGNVQDYSPGSAWDMPFYLAGMAALSMGAGAAASAGLGSMGGSVGNAVGAGNGAFGTAVGNAAINTAGNAVAGNQVNLGSTAGSLAGSYLSQNTGDLSNSFNSGGYSIEPNSFDAGSFNYGGETGGFNLSDTNMGDEFSLDPSMYGSGVGNYGSFDPSGFGGTYGSGELPSIDYSNPGSVLTQYGNYYSPDLSSLIDNGSLLSSLGDKASAVAKWLRDNPQAAKMLGAGAGALLGSGLFNSTKSNYNAADYKPMARTWQPTWSMPAQAPAQTLLQLPTTGVQNSGLWRYQKGLLGG